MPYVFQTFNKRTGSPHPLWRFEYYDHAGRKRKATGTTTRKETEKIAMMVQAEQHRIRNGVSAPPRSCDEPRSIDQLVAEYIQWGNTQGGRRGRPWASEHARKREQDLAFWKKALRLRTQHDLLDSQSRVERVVYGLHIEKRRSGKTCFNKVDCLRTFCRWLVDRDYLACDPLRKLKPPNADPVHRRRPLLPEEVGRLLEKCLPERKLLYEVALCTGLRANELRNITPLHLDSTHMGIRLEAAWTKNRLDGFQPVPQWLMAKLVAEAVHLAPQEPFFKVQKTHPARMIQDDLERADIAAFKPGEGKVVFHSLRMTYCTLLDYSGASAKENQELARHSTPTLTMQRYVRTRQERVRDVVEALGKAVNPASASQHYPNKNPSEAEPRLKLLSTG